MMAHIARCFAMISIILKYGLTGITFSTVIVKKMPVYVYKCNKCGKELEAVQSFDDEPLKVCPDCGMELRRKIQQASVKFVGNGWYSTDNRGE